MPRSAGDQLFSVSTQTNQQKKCRVLFHPAAAAAEPGSGGPESGPSLARRTRQARFQAGPCKHPRTPLLRRCCAAVLLLAGPPAHIVPRLLKQAGFIKAHPGRPIPSHPLGSSQAASRTLGNGTTARLRKNTLGRAVHGEEPSPRPPDPRLAGLSVRGSGKNAAAVVRPSVRPAAMTRSRHCVGARCWSPVRDSWRRAAPAPGAAE